VMQVLRRLQPAVGEERGARRPRAPRKSLRVGPVEVDPERLEVLLHRQGLTTRVDLPPTELKVLCCLMDEAHRVVSRERILKAVWGEGSVHDPRTVDQNIKRLRQHLHAAGADDLVQTRRGLGYRFTVPSP
jgi:DNA-binding response OmpR family regulator